MSKIQSVIKLSFKEYIDVWSDMILTFYQQGLSNDSLLEDMKLTADLKSQFALELATVLTVVANLSFQAKPKMLTSEKNLEKLRSGILFDAYEKIFSDGDEAFLSSCKNLYENRYRIFEQLCKKVYSKDPAVRQEDLIGFARYLVGQVCSDAETNHSVSLEQLGILLSVATDTFIRLVENTAQDTMQLDGKPSFTVKK